MVSLINGYVVIIHLVTQEFLFSEEYEKLENVNLDALSVIVK